MVSLENFMTASQTVSALTYKDIESKLKAVELSLQNIGKAIRYNEIFAGDHDRVGGYASIMLADVSALGESIERSLSYAGFMDHSRDKNLIYVRQRSSALVSSIAVGECLKQTVEFIKSEEPPPYFMQMPAIVEPKNSFIRTHGILQTMVSAMIEVNFNKTDQSEKLVVDADELADTVIGMSDVFQEAGGFIREHLSLCYNEEPILLNFSEHIRAFTPC